MNIALVTNKELHHKFWVYSLFKKNNVKLIIHPKGKNNFLNKVRFKIIKYGFIYSIIKIFSLIFNLFYSQKNRYEKKHFSKYRLLYDKIPKNIIHNVKTINSISSVNLIKNNKIDIICFLGGEIAKSTFINSAKVCTLNYHSGLSPFFNGNNALINTYRKENLNFIGGTLMIMNSKIDLGNILSHYLTPINKNDKIYDLFMNTIKGSVHLYQNFLDKVKFSKAIPKGIKQLHKFNYYKNIDWTIVDDIKLNYYQKYGNQSNFYRKEKSIYYYNRKEDDFNFLLINLLKSIQK